ncbi:MAG: hypothetical protein ABH856_02735 [Patescibacteria group bacterium]|nr:hypothetical protein [Patescibacteria group bacterium]
MTIDWEKLKKELEAKEKYKKVLRQPYELCERCGTRMIEEQRILRCPKCGAERTCDE